MPLIQTRPHAGGSSTGVSAAGVSTRTGLGRDMESARRIYRPRDPRKTVLWGLVDTLYERVKGQWEERFERRYGPCTSAVNPALHRSIR